MMSPSKMKTKAKYVRTRQKGQGLKMFYANMMKRSSQHLFYMLEAII